MKTLWIFKEHVTRSVEHKSMGLAPGEHVYATYTDFKDMTWQAAKQVAKEQIIREAKYKHGEVGDIYWVMDVAVISTPNEASYLIGGKTKWLGGHSQETNKEVSGVREAI